MRRFENTEVGDSSKIFSGHADTLKKFCRVEKAQKQQTFLSSTAQESGRNRPYAEHGTG
jgi:hypothetical protein